jgi:hypothetical protein
MFTGGYCMDAGNDGGGPIAHYDAAGPWSFAAPNSMQFQDDIASGERDPVSMKFVSLGASGLALYDPATRKYEFVAASLKKSSGGYADMDALGYANHMVYHPPSDTFYYFVRGTPVQTFALVLDRANPASSKLDKVATTGPTSPHWEPSYDYDSSTMTIGGGVIDSTFYRFDPATATWTSHAIPESPGTQAFHSLAFDPVNEVYIFVADYDSGRHTWAYRP